MDVCAPDFYELLQEIEFNFFVSPCGAVRTPFVSGNQSFGFCEKEMVKRPPE
jgi:hypothetical protein